MTSRRQVLERLADLVAAEERAHVLRVGIDGVDGAGKTTLAEELAPLLHERGRSVIRASIDGFHNPSEIRYQRGPLSPEGFYLDSYDLAAVTGQLLTPLGPEGDGVYREALFDWRTNVPVPTPQQQASGNEILLFDGIFLHRPELREHWDLSVFVDVSFATSLRHNIARAEAEHGVVDRGALREHFDKRYMPGQRLYLEACRPEARASVVLDNNDLEHPRLVRTPDA